MILMINEYDNEILKIQIKNTMILLLMSLTNQNWEILATFFNNIQQFCPTGTCSWIIPSIVDK